MDSRLRQIMLRMLDRDLRRVDRPRILFAGIPLYALYGPNGYAQIRTWWRDPNASWRHPPAVEIASWTD